LRFLRVSPRVYRVSFGIPTGENKAKEKKKNKEVVKTGSREAEEQKDQEVEQQNT
jgi:hypothetical protein